MPTAVPHVAAPSSQTLDSIGTPMLWGVSIAVVVALVALDFLLTRRPHAVSMKEALGWSAFYIALPLAFGGWVWAQHGSERGVEYLTGYLVEKSLSVDNLFVFMLLLVAFVVPRELQQRVLLYGIVGALVLRGIFIAVGAAALSAFDVFFLLFGAILVATGGEGPRGHPVRQGPLRQRRPAPQRARLARRFFPVTGDYDGPADVLRDRWPRAITPLALVVVAVLATDVVFAVDSVPAVYGITERPLPGVRRRTRSPCSASARSTSSSRARCRR